MAKAIIPKLVSLVLAGNANKAGERHNFTRKVKDEVVRKQKGKCAECQSYVAAGNVISIIRMGIDLIIALRLLHTRCHRKRHAIQRNHSHNNPLLKRLLHILFSCRICQKYINLNLMYKHNRP
jgi:hypothetical protein